MNSRSSVEALDVFLLSVAVLELAAGPLVFRMVRGARWASILLHVAVPLSVGALVVFEVLPECVEVAGIWSVAVAFAGFLLPAVLEHSAGRAIERTRVAALSVVVLGLVIHEGMDGAALVAPQGAPETWALRLAILLHRVPAALAVWWFVGARLGRGFAIAALAAMGLATCVGFLLATRIAPIGGSEMLAYFQALVGGALLHVLFESQRLRLSVRQVAERTMRASREDPTTPRARVAIDPPK